MKIPILRLFLLAGSVSVVACSGREAGSALPGPSASPPSPLVSSGVSGYVADVAFRALAGASVEISSRDRVVAVLTTNDGGSFEYTGTFDAPITVRVSQEGFLPQSTVATPKPQVRVSFYLAGSEPPAQIEPGEYTLTFIATGTCPILPAQLRTRSFAASISSPIRDSYAVRVNGTSHWLGGVGTFGIGVVRDFVAVTDDTAPQFIESPPALPPFTYLEFGAGGSFTTTAPVLSTLSFPAGVAYCELRSAASPYFCQSAPAERVMARTVCHGQVTLTRR